MRRIAGIFTAYDAENISLHSSAFGLAPLYLADLVSAVPGPGADPGRADAGPGPGEGSVLGAAPRDPVDRAAASAGEQLLDGFEGKLTTSKWARMAWCSQDTAGRDIADLIDKGILEKEGAGGRSTSYRLAPPG